jgi:nucleoside permease NupC
MNTLGNTVGALAGLTGPLVVSALLNSYRDTTAWSIVFFLTFLQSVLALVVFYFYQADHIIEVLNTPVRR